MSSEQDSKLPDLRYIRELAKVFKQYELDELEIETEGTRMLLRRGDMPTQVVASMPAASGPVAIAPAAVAAVAEPQAAAPGDFITSPFVGTFYRAARPDTPSFCEVGDKLSGGQTVCIIEAMKLFNEIEAEFPCVVEEVLIDNGQPVEYGAKLFRVRKL